MGHLLLSDATLYFSTRSSQGFNAIQFDIVATAYAGINNNPYYGTPDGITPFSPAISYVTSPNPRYFVRVDQYVNLCAQYGLVAILNPYETGAGITDLVNAGMTVCNTFGQYLGNRYKNFANVMWQLGNDFTVDSQIKFNIVQALAEGILGANPNHLMTIELMSPPPEYRLR